MPERRRREVATLPDGTEVVQTKRPRADLLMYPHGQPLVTVLVRRTHDVALARELAEQRWRENGGDTPLTRYRIGWWTTTTGRVAPPRGAIDDQTRVVVWCDDPARAHSAGPGIEFRP